MHQRTNACSTAAAVPKLQKRVRESLLQKVCEREQEREAREREREREKEDCKKCIWLQQGCIRELHRPSARLTADVIGVVVVVDVRAMPAAVAIFFAAAIFANIRLEADHKKKSTPELLFSLYSCFFLSFYLFYLSINYLSFYVSISQGSLSIPAFIGIFLCFYLSSLSI